MKYSIFHMAYTPAHEIKNIIKEKDEMVNDDYTIFEFIQNRKGAINSAIKEPRDFQYLCTRFNHLARENLFNIIRPRLDELISSIYDFIAIIMYLKEDQVNQVYELFKGDLLYYIDDSEDLMLLMENLNLLQRAEIISALGENVYEIIKNDEDYMKLRHKLWPAETNLMQKLYDI